MIGSSFQQLLDEYSHLDFVKRARNPNGPQVDGMSGHPSTHIMATEVDREGNWYSFPTLVRKSDGTMHRFTDNFEAMNYALKTGEYIPFGRDKDAAIRFGGDGYKDTPGTSWMK